MTDKHENDTVAETLRLIWPQWQGATAANIEALLPEIPLATARRGYAFGAATLSAILPEHGGTTAVVPTSFTMPTVHSDGEVESRDIVHQQLLSALTVIHESAPRRIVTLGGECSVSVAPFSYLRSLYGEDLAVVWIDSHPDIGTERSEYEGYHAMALSMLTGNGPADLTAELPATFDAAQVSIAGLHSWTDDDFPNVANWGIQTFSPADVRDSSSALLSWLASTGCSRVVLHIDVDAVDSNEAIFGLGAEPDGLSTEQVKRLVADIAGSADVVGLTIAEFIPRQLMQMTQFLEGFPLLPSNTSPSAHTAADLTENKGLSWLL